MSWEGYLFVYLPGELEAVPTGRLVLEETGPESTASRFGYGRRYLVRPNAVPVDPVSLPLSCLPGDEATYEPLHPPLFGAVRDAAPDFWGRRVIEARLEAPPNSLPESAYLLHAGPHRFGALDFRPTLDSPETAGLLPPIAKLDYLMEAVERVEQGLPMPAQLEPIFTGGTMGGARPKALVIHRGEQYLAKFPAKGDGFDVPVVERACLELARRAGLDVPPTELVRLADDRAVMLIERFDRKAKGEGFLRRHAVSALTLLAKDESESLGARYEEIAERIGRLGVDGRVQADRNELYGRIAFNILVSNDDDHLRNHAFVWDDVGKGWRLSPLYDVVPRPQVAAERYLHLSVGPRGRLATLDNLLEAHGAFGLLKREAARIIERVASVVREWRVVFEELGVPEEQCEKVASAFRRPSDIGLEVVGKAR
ncbi:MAG TPA: HipA domain-containing protein [Pseudothauera hydrothermalis]|nr:HipA domain-containing protein [Pseudothauera hydrothermalis]